MNKNRDNPQDERRAERRRMDQDARRSIQHHMSVRGLDGEDVGSVDRVEGDYLKVEGGDGNPHWIPDGYVMRVEQYVHLNVNADEVQAVWRDDDPGAHPQRGTATARHEAGEEPKQREHKTHEQRNEKQ